MEQKAFVVLSVLKSNSSESWSMMAVGSNKKRGIRVKKNWKYNGLRLEKSNMMVRVVNLDHYLRSK